MALRWQDLEAEAERVVTEVMGDLENPVHSATSETTSSPSPTLRWPKLREWVLLIFGATAVSLAGLMWVSQLSQPGTQSIVPVTPSVASPQTNTARQQQLLADYQARLAQTRSKLATKDNLGPADPFSTPYNQRRSTSSYQTRYTLPQFTPPPVSAPLVPPELKPLPPLPNPLAASQGLPTALVPETTPTLVGVVGEGTKRTALFQQGAGFKEVKAGEQLNDGWVVQEIQPNQAIMKKGSQTRTVSLGGN